MNKRMKKCIHEEVYQQDKIGSKINTRIYMPRKRCIDKKNWKYTTQRIWEPQMRKMDNAALETPPYAFRD